MLFKNENSLYQLKEIKFGDKMAIQRFCETNIKGLMGLSYVASDFDVGHVNIDTLAYDGLHNRFVIIIYIHDNQPKALNNSNNYLDTIKLHKAELVLKFNKRYSKFMDVSDFEWADARLYFVSPEYTAEQLSYLNSTSNEIILWKLCKFENDLVLFEEISPASKASGGKKEPDDPVYTEDSFLFSASVTSKMRYQNIRDFILGLDDNITLSFNKLCAVFDYMDERLIDIELQTNSILVFLNRKFGTINDPRHMIQNMTGKGHHGNGNCRIKISHASELNYVKGLIEAHFVDKRRNAFAK